MKKLFLLFPMIVLAVLMLASCGQWVPPGYVGIKVNSLGANRGVDSEVLGVGRHYIGLYAHLYTYPTFIKQYAFTKRTNEGSPTDESFQFQTKEGVNVDVDVAVQAAADPAKVTELFQAYRVPMDDILHTYVRQDLRNLFIKYSSTLGVDDLYGDGKSLLLQEVQHDLKAEYAPRGLIIDSVSYLSAIRFPTAITEAIQAKQQATQQALQAQNAIATAKAEAQQVEAKAEGQAQANRMLEQSITPELLQYQAIQKWDGKLPQVTGQSTPFVNLNNH